MVPFGRNPRFVGREDEITKLDRLIRQENGPTKIAICGLGGVGKTQVALELAYRTRDRDCESSIFWIPCMSHESVEQAYISIAQMVGIQDVKPTEVKDQVKTYLSHKSNGKWILIFDNADNMDMWFHSSNITLALKDFLPQNKQGHIIFTTRNRKLAVKLASSYVIPIPELDEETGVDILNKLLIRKDLVNDKDITIAFLKQLTFLPLAIAQAAAYVNENDIRLTDYITLLWEQELDVIELLSEDFEDEGRYTNIQNPVATTWLISFQQIQYLNQLAADYLSLMACINPRAIPRSFLPQHMSKKKQTDAIGLLKAYSFISEQAGDNCLSLHRLVYLATRNWMRKNKQFSLQVLKTADRLSEVFPDNSHANRKMWREYLPHALSLIGDGEFQKQQREYINFLQRVARCLYSDWRHKESQALFNHIVGLQQGKYGNMSPSTLTSMAWVASTYAAQGQWKEAEELEVQVLKTRKQVSGQEHLDTLISMANLASTYRAQGRWKEAEELEVQVLKTRKQVLGQEHPSTLTSMANLASTYRTQGRWKEAEELEVQVLKTRKQVLGQEHPDTLTSMRNLAYTWKSLGKAEDALVLTKKCV
jgi:hypothetical protein